MQYEHQAPICMNWYFALQRQIAREERTKAKAEMERKYKFFDQTGEQTFKEKLQFEIKE